LAYRLLGQNLKGLAAKMQKNRQFYIKTTAQKHIKKPSKFNLPINK
jgi:hypothetical protein